MTASFLGSGLSFPVQTDAGGALITTGQEARVAQSIWIILGTARGERRMRPDFGCGIHDLMFENNTPATAGRVVREVREALSRFEPRIEVDEVVVTPADTGSGLLIDIAYRLRASNVAFNLVYPFYLNGGGVG